MTDPETITLTSVGAVAMKEGIKFLYGQAAEVLKRWRERGRLAEKQRNAPPNEKLSEPVSMTLPPVFEGQLSNPEIHFDVVRQVEPDLRRLVRDLSEYVNDIDPSDETSACLQDGAELRLILERIY